ncbi:hypothetical protein [Rhodohalobacter barkolensis]|uniref:Uncharacterized protein n=1 Tax=Rhodohalobacter barkolensis TaxID=2053187 RepID=A0A2N0VF37_9BACT|nr:hypothetical protein [Rhodohalobacter barkolensis]PKD42785.1 hypothetical protein CWD77_13100 [Rhodohalobacter barkolensis]
MSYGSEGISTYGMQADAVLNQAQPETSFDNEFVHEFIVSSQTGEESKIDEGSNRSMNSSIDYSIVRILNGESKGEKNSSESFICMPKAPAQNFDFSTTQKHQRLSIPIFIFIR